MTALWVSKLLSAEPVQTALLVISDNC